MKKLLFSLFALFIFAPVFAPVAHASDCFSDPIYDRNWNGEVTTGMFVRDVACMEGSTVIATVPVGEVVKVIAETDGWYKVQTKDGVIGWSGQWLLEQTSKPFTSNEPQEPLYDIVDHKYEDAVRYLEDNEIIEGYPDGSFKPEDSVNRAEFTKIIVGAKLGSEPAKPSSNCFPDVNKDAWYATWVCYAKDNGIIGGYPDNTFKPAENINLAEAAKILVNTLNINMSSDTSGDWYEVFIRSMQNLSYIPDSFGTVSQLVNRSQMAEMVYRIMEEITSKPAKSFVFEEASSPSTNLTCADQDVPSSVDIDTVRATWFSWVNQARNADDLNSYGPSEVLDATAQAWSDYSADVGVMSHTRPGQTDYYDYSLITQWFTDLGVTFKNAGGWTYSENIGRTYLNCDESDCTQELIDGSKLIFDAYMAEKGTSYTDHYDSVMSSAFKIMGVAWSFSGTDVYITVHYAAELDQTPNLTCNF